MPKSYPSHGSLPTPHETWLPGIGYGDIRHQIRSCDMFSAFSVFYPCVLVSFPSLRAAGAFCRNWKTAVATSAFSGFLSGCHDRRSDLHSWPKRSRFLCHMSHVLKKDVLEKRVRNK